VVTTLIGVTALSDIGERSVNDRPDPNLWIRVDLEVGASDSGTRTPMLVLPDDTDCHRLQTSIQVVSLAPNAGITVFP
jgi:hypothetical protein